MKLRDMIEKLEKMEREYGNVEVVKKSFFNALRYETYIGIQPTIDPKNPTIQLIEIY